MPTPMPPNVRIEFYHVLGGFITRYGYIDSLIADMCSVLVERMGGHPQIKKPPQAMTARRELITKCYRDKPELAEDKSAIAKLLTTTTAIDDRRHFIVHGCQTDYFPEQNSYQFTKLDRRRDQSGYDQISTVMTHDELVHLTYESQEVVKALTPIGRRLRKIAGLDEET